MKATLCALLLLALGAALAPAAEPARGDDFKSYRYVRVRNIFDPNRHSDPADGTPSRPAPPSVTNGRPPFLALTGVLVQPQKTVGFFGGSSPDFNGVYRPGDSVAGFRVRGLSLTGAELEREGKTVLLPVGSQMALDGAGTIQAFTPDPASNPPPSAPPPQPSFSSGGDSSRSGSSRSDYSRSGSSNSTPTLPPGMDADTIRRLMKERRKKER